MDKPLVKTTKKKYQNKYLYGAISMILFIGIFAFTQTSASLSNSKKNYNVTTDNLVISTIKQAGFSEYLPLRGVVEPEKTIFIDAIDGGRVEEVLIQEGALVEQGQAILKLSNTNLQLNVLAREAEVSEQINNMRNTRLALEQNQLSLKRDVIELDFKVLRLKKQFTRNQALMKKNLISEQAYETVKDELDFQLKYRETVQQSQQKEALLQNQQLEQLAQSIKTLESNLAISRGSLDKLIIRAPTTGQLTFLDAQVGESKSNGQRLGQVDLIEQYKVTAKVDEFYISRVTKGQTASFELNQQTYHIAIAKVYPGIDNGTFKVDFKIAGKTIAKQLRLGQSVQLKFNLSSSESKLLIANGGFMQNTAGSWVFVINKDGTQASKRAISLGRKNPQTIEVLSGLTAGERVITSSYASFADAEQLSLSGSVYP